MDVQAILHTALVQQAQGYAVVLQQAAELAVACLRGETIDERLQPILAELQRLAQREADLAWVKEQWEKANRPADAPLRRVLDQLAALIRQVGRELNTIEACARRRREELAAELDVCNRLRQMQRAYQRKT